MAPLARVDVDEGRWRGIGDPRRRRDGDGGGANGSSAPRSPLPVERAVTRGAVRPATAQGIGAPSAGHRAFAAGERRRRHAATATAGAAPAGPRRVAALLARAARRRRRERLALRGVCRASAGRAGVGSARSTARRRASRAAAPGARRRGALARRARRLVAVARPRRSAVDASAPSFAPVVAVAGPSRRRRRASTRARACARCRIASRVGGATRRRDVAARASTRRRPAPRSRRSVRRDALRRRRGAGRRAAAKLRRAARAEKRPPRRLEPGRGRGRGDHRGGRDAGGRAIRRVRCSRSRRCACIRIATSVGSTASVSLRGVGADSPGPASSAAGSRSPSRASVALSVALPSPRRRAGPSHRRCAARSSARRPRATGGTDKSTGRVIGVAVAGRRRRHRRHPRRCRRRAPAARSASPASATRRRRRALSNASVQPRCSDSRSSALRQRLAGERDQLGVRPLDRQLGVVRLDQAAHERARLGVARPRPRAGRRVLELGQVAPQHRRQAEQVAAPVELARRREVAVAAGLERAQQARRLVLVVGLLRRSAARCRAARPRRARTRSRSARCRRSAAAATWPRACGSKSAGPTGMQTLSALRSRWTRRSSWIASSAIRLWRASAHQCAQSSKTLRSVVAVALERQQRRPVVDGDAGVVGLHQRRAGRPRRGRSGRRRAPA